MLSQEASFHWFSFSTIYRASINMIPVPNFLIISSLLSAITFIIFLGKLLSRTASIKLPPSPRKLPLIGNLHQLGVHPHRSLHSLSKHYGSLMLLHLGKVPLLVASSSEAARQIMKDQDLIFASRPKLSMADKLFYGLKDVAFAPYGEYWRNVRSICILQLLSKKRVQSFRRVREEETSLMVERIALLGSLQQAVNLSEVLSSLSNDVICRAALGRKQSEYGKLFIELLNEFIELLGAQSIRDCIPWLGWVDRVSGLDSRAERIAKRFDEFLNGVIEEHRKNRTKGEEEKDFLDILLDHHTQHDEESILEDDSLKALTLQMFVAGTHTTSTALTWTMAELIRDRKTMNKLQSEVREISRTNENEITEDDLDKMQYLKAVIKESLRLHPPNPLLVPHESTKDTKLFSYDIPKGTQVMISAWAIGRDPLIWKNPDKFSPERFLESETDYKGLHFELLPFGAGRRGCPGVGFAENVIELALAKLVNHFDFAMPDGESEENLDMSEGNGITVHKRLPLVLVATPHAF